MRKTWVLFLLLLLLLAVAVCRSLWPALRAGSDQGRLDMQPHDAGPTALAPEQAKSATVRPIFDIVRAEPDGSVVMAGRAEPGWTVTVESSGRMVGQAVADANGEWIIEPAGKLSKGEHSLELSARIAERRAHPVLHAAARAFALRSQGRTAARRADRGRQVHARPADAAAFQRPADCRSPGEPR